ncbi:MAG: YceI family protein [Roseovarius sp.]|nr:YceI family protein [Roseovarius sp.]
MIRVLLFCLLGLAGLVVAPAHAAPENYRLDAHRSTVTFTFAMDGTARTGHMPVHAARMSLDIDNLPASQVDVTLDASAARAGFFLATQAMRGPLVLDVAHHPFIRFRSTAVTGSLTNATVTGDLTLRGVTRKVTLRAAVYRQPDTAPTDRDRLIVLLTGGIDRRAFGASGYAGLIGDHIGLRILAYIAK